MASDKPVASANGAEEADLAKAFLELAKGERTAAALEKQLSAMEAKIEALLAQAEQDQRDVDEIKAGGSANGEAAEAGKTDDQR